MATRTFTQGAKSATVLNLGTLASNTYVAHATSIDRGASIPADTVLEIVCDPNGAPSGNKQLLLFCQLSADNTDFSSGPTSGTTVTEEADLHFIGSLPCNDTNTHRKQFSLEKAGIPRLRYVKPVVKNDLGVALTSGNVYQIDITETIA
jgi:hypothetical protein